jgi:putative membrane protein
MRAVAAVGAMAMIASACDRRDNAVARGDSAAGALGTRVDTTVKPIVRNDWTDESILAYLHAENADEVKVNELAMKKATTPAVREFARKMAADHRVAQKEVQSMIGNTKSMQDSTHQAMMKGKMNDTTHVDTAHGKARDVLEKTRDELKDLTDKKAGADWDKDYIDMQIDEHKEVLDKLTDAAKSTTNKDLQALLVKMTGEVQAHLTKAEAIKATFK